MIDGTRGRREHHALVREWRSRAHAERHAAPRQRRDPAMLATTPPPPSPPPSLPLEVGDPRCLDLGLGSLLGSARYLRLEQRARAQSVAPRARGPNASFAHLLAARLRRSHDAQWNADGGSGPMFAGACASHFIPPNTRLATIEYLPNMGYIKEDHAEVAAVRSMLRMMAARGAAAFVVNIVSGTKRYENDARGGGQGAACKRLGWKEELVGCMGRERILHFRDLLARAANETGAHVVTIDADEAPHLFGADSFHLNRNGHKTVFNEIWRVLRALPCADRHAGDASAATSRTGPLLRSASACAGRRARAARRPRPSARRGCRRRARREGAEVGWVANATDARAVRAPAARAEEERERVVAERKANGGGPGRCRCGRRAARGSGRARARRATARSLASRGSTAPARATARATAPARRWRARRAPRRHAAEHDDHDINLNVAEVEPPSAGRAAPAAPRRVRRARDERRRAGRAEARAPSGGAGDDRRPQRLAHDAARQTRGKRSSLEGVRRN